MFKDINLKTTTSLAFKTEKRKPLLVYFDQCIWIDITERQKIKNAEFLKEIIKSIDDDMIRICINATNLCETSHKPDRASRESVCDTMLDLSRGWSFPPYDKMMILKIEIDNCLSLALSTFTGVQIPMNDPRDSISKHCLLGDFAFDGETSNINKFYKYIDNRDGFNAMWFNQDMMDEQSENEAKLKINYEIDYKKQIIQMNDEISRTKYERDAYFDCKDIVRDIIPILLDIVTKFNKTDPLVCRKVILPFCTDAAKNIKIFIQHLPSYYTYLKFSRYIECKKRHEINDMYDINSFTFPVAYFDCVVGERTMIGVAKSKGLDKIYNIKLFVNIDEFCGWLESL